MKPGFLGSVMDAAAGPVGSAAWVASRAKRFDGELCALTGDEMAEMRRRFAAAAHRASPAPARQYPFVIPGRELACIDGRLQSVADADETTPFVAVDDTAKAQRRIEAERVYHAICSDECGVVVDPELLAKKKAEKAALRAQSHAIARKLEQAGEIAYRSGEWSLWVYGIHSGEVETVPQFRRVSFIPYVAAQIREPFVRELEYFLSRYPFARFWTFSSGERCRVEDLRERLKDLHRRISTLNGEDFMQAAGVEIVFRSSELGSIEETRESVINGEAGVIGRDEQGRPLYHPHAHCVAILKKGRMEKAAWSKFLEKIWAHWGDHWQDGDERGGPIRKVRELVKYVSKPSELQHLTPTETKDLFHALRRLKLCHPMGILAAEIKAREEAGKTLVRERTDDGFIWREVENWNRGEPTSEDRQPFLAHYLGEDFIGPPELAGISDRDMQRANKLSAADVDTCVVVARCTPSASSLGIKEPRVVVMGKRWDANRVNNHPLVLRLWEQTYDAWQAGMALIRVHTGTPTVGRQPGFGFMPDLAERVAPPGLPVFSGS